MKARTVTPTTLAGPFPECVCDRYARLKELQDEGLVEQRPRTRTGRTFSLHPSQKLLEEWHQLSDRINRLAADAFTSEEQDQTSKDYYFGGSYLSAQSIPPLKVLPEPLRMPGGVRVLVHSDPTFMVMDSLKRQFEQVIGNDIHQRAFSIDRLHEEALKNADRKVSRYDIIAIDLPWVGEFVEKGILLPLDEIMDVERLDPPTFIQPAGRPRTGVAILTAFPRRRPPSCCLYAGTCLQRPE